RWNRPDVVRIHYAQERIADLGKVVVDLEVRPCRQQRERFDEPFDMRVLALGRLELQPAGDLRIGPRELGAHLPQKGQLALIVVQQIITHRRLPAAGTGRSTHPGWCRTPRVRGWGPCAAWPRSRSAVDDGSACRPPPFARARW